MTTSMTTRTDPWRFIGLEPEPDELPPPAPIDLGDQLDILTSLENQQP